MKFKITELHQQGNFLSLKTEEFLRENGFIISCIYNVHTGEEYDVITINSFDDIIKIKELVKEVYIEL